MLRITAVSAGLAGARYPWECAQHESQDQSREAYYTDGGSDARWIGVGVESVGFQVGAQVAKSDYLILFGQLCDPAVYRRVEARAADEIQALGLDGDEAKQYLGEALEVVRLGRAPRRFRPVEQRLAERLAAEPDAGPDRRAQIEQEVLRTQRQPVGYFDLTFSAQKSVSLYHAGLLAAGRREEAAQVLDAHRAAVAAAVEWLQGEAGYSRAGYHGRSVDGRASVGRYVDARDWIGADFVHHTSRAGEPQLHSHATILNRVRTVDVDGTVVWRTLDSRALHKARPAAAAVYERTLEERITAARPVEFELRPDGRSRELIGITAEERDAWSTRRRETTGKLAEYVQAYRDSHDGAEPSPYLLTLMSETAALHTRRGKEASVPLEELIGRWEQMAARRQAASHAELAQRAEAAGVARRREHGGQEVAEWDRAAVITAAVAQVQRDRASWTRAELIQALRWHLPERLDVGTDVAQLLDILADEALSGEYEVVQVDGFELISPPQQLRRESDGRSVYRPGRDERYATAAQLSEEQRLLVRAQAGGAPVVQRDTIEAVIEAAGLVDDQAAVVRGVLGDGRRMSPVVGPAGAGKSYVQGVITRAWEEHVGARVIGLTTSNVAAAVLREEGVATATNIERFLLHARGVGSPADRARFAVRAGDLLIVDEAGMVNHEHFRQISQIAETAGAKVVPVGDPAQIGAVGAGGGFRLIVRETQAYELSTVRRFRDRDGTIRQWEAEASLQLREGNPAALAAYDQHGRLAGGTLEEMTEAVTRAYVADVLAGRQAVVVASTNERADELSAQIRAELVRLGRVEDGGVRVLGGNVAGVGDLVQTRANEASLVDSAGLPVINRRLYQVTGRGRDGSLTVQHVTGDQRGGVVRLPADYMQHVALGYAGTTHATQGRTVEHGYLLAEAMTSREAAYVGLTRGRYLNRAFVVTQLAGDEHQLEVTDSHPITEMARILGHETAERSAVEVLRAGLDHHESLPALAPIWADVIGERHQADCRQIIAGILGPHAVARLDAEAADPLYRRVREAQLRGHEPAAVLREAIGDPRSVGDARELGALLNWRVEQTVAGREPERAPAGADWRERTPQLPGEVGDYLRQVAEAMQARQVQLGEAAAEQPPTWAIDRLGPVPEDVIARAQWTARAATVAAYRELYGVDAAGTVIGAAPARGAVEQRAAWEAAFAALGNPEEHRHVAEASDAQLRAWIARYERAQSWAPDYVADEMRQMSTAALDYAERATITRAEAEQADDPDQVPQLTSRARSYAQLAQQMQHRAAILVEIHQARQAWYSDTEPIRTNADAARVELARRQVDAGEQPTRKAAPMTQPPNTARSTNLVPAQRVPVNEVTPASRDLSAAVATLTAQLDRARAYLQQRDAEQADREADDARRSAAAYRAREAQTRQADRGPTLERG
ncbi:MobF family relaxase [Salinispora mooreana]|uniref:MobF family relaxase n=2 Tax=Salinispora mooreana TaxID=999545 RepID=UPI001CC7E05C|nr:MobF family relaxase [Salinispora mooreana]